MSVLPRNSLRLQLWKIRTTRFSSSCAKFGFFQTSFTEAASQLTSLIWMVHVILPGILIIEFADVSVSFLTGITNKVPRVGGNFFDNLWKEMEWVATCHCCTCCLCRRYMVIRSNGIIVGKIVQLCKVFLPGKAWRWQAFRWFDLFIKIYYSELKKAFEVQDAQGLSVCRIRGPVLSLPCHK